MIITGVGWSQQPGAALLAVAGQPPASPGVGIGELVHVFGGGGVEIEGPGQGVEHLLRRVGLPALLQPYVVVGADARQQGHLFAA
jgi:hypothetical protein